MKNKKKYIEVGKKSFTAAKCSKRFSDWLKDEEHSIRKIMQMLSRKKKKKLVNA